MEASSVPRHEHNRNRLPQELLCKLIDEILTGTNTVRREHQIPSLALHLSLTIEAQNHAEAVARGNQHFSHENACDRIFKAGHFEAVGENLARLDHFQNYRALSQATVEEWKKSPGHMRNLKMDFFNVCGIGIAGRGGAGGATGYSNLLHGGPEYDTLFISMYFACESEKAEKANCNNNCLAMFERNKETTRCSSAGEVWVAFSGRSGRVGSPRGRHSSASSSTSKTGNLITTTNPSASGTLAGNPQHQPSSSGTYVDSNGNIVRQRRNAGGDDSVSFGSNQNPVAAGSSSSGNPPAGGTGTSAVGGSSSSGSNPNTQPTPQDPNQNPPNPNLNERLKHFLNERLKQFLEGFYIPPEDRGPILCFLLLFSPLLTPVILYLLDWPHDLPTVVARVNHQYNVGMAHLQYLIQNVAILVDLLEKIRIILESGNPDTNGPNSNTVTDTSYRHSTRTTTTSFIGNPECWVGGFDYDFCCRHYSGPSSSTIILGNPQCWDSVFTYDRCCMR